MELPLISLRNQRTRVWDRGVQAIIAKSLRMSMVTNPSPKGVILNRVKVALGEECECLCCLQFIGD